MRSLPKWLPMEGIHSSSIVSPPHEDAGTYTNMTFRTVQGCREGKAPCFEPCEADKRSFLHFVHHLYVSDHRTGHINAGTDNKLDYKIFEESSGNKMDGKTEKDKKVQVRGDDSKEGKYDRIAYNDSKTDAKSEKEIYGSGSGLPSRKEHQKEKSYADGLVVFGDADRVHQRMHLHGTVDLRKEYLTNYQKEHIGAKEDVGDNKIVLKGDDRDKDKDRKRKEGKHRDWGERDKSGDRDSLQFASGGNNYNELARDEREGDRKDVSKEKEGRKDSSKDYINREARNPVDKEVPHGEKEIVDHSTIQDKAALDQKKPKEIDGWRNAGKEAGERRKERDDYGEGERPEKRTRCTDKEPNDGGIDVHTVADKEKESSTCGVQQQKGTLQTDNSQVPNLETRFWHCALKSDRLKGKPEVTTIVYKVGECMQELLKLWKEYDTHQVDKKEQSSFGGPTIEVKIPGQHVTATNRQVRREQLWGTDVYTDDSDLVAVLMHMGYCRTSTNPAASDLQDLRVIIRVLPPQDYYVSTWKNNVRSRSWVAGIGCSFRVEQCFLVKKGCEPREIKRSLTDSSTIEPTFAPISVGRTMTTRAAASNASRKQRMVKEVVILYSLSNEPWIKYSINIVADKGLKKSTFTSARLKKGEALYMETRRQRYELCFIREKVVKSGSTHETEAKKSQSHHPDVANHSRSTADGEIVDVFRFSRCKKILPQTIMLKHGIPLPADMLEVLEDNLDWEDVLWSQNGVWIGGKEYQLARVQFITPTLNVASLV